MTPHTGGQQIITMHMLPDILQSKRNQTMGFGQLIKYGMRNIFLEKSYIKCGGKASSGSFDKELKLSKSLDQQSEML